MYCPHNLVRFIPMPGDSLNTQGKYLSIGYSSLEDAADSRAGALSAGVSFSWSKLPP